MGETPPSRWREASERLRSTARLFVSSLAAVAVTVVAGLSLTGLASLDPLSPFFWLAVSGALVATISVVVMLALSMRLASTSAVTISELIAVTPAAGGEYHGTKRGVAYAAAFVSDPRSGYLLGFRDLSQFGDHVKELRAAERLAFQTAAEERTDASVEAWLVKEKEAAWHVERMAALIEAAGYHRLRWNFGATAGWMAGAGAAAAVGIVLYAASLQPGGVPSGPVAVTTHERVTIAVPTDAAAGGLYFEMVGCESSVAALVTDVSDSAITVITIPRGSCRSVTMSAEWSGRAWVAAFETAGSASSDPSS